MTRGDTALQGRVHDRVPRRPVVEWTFSAKGAVTSEAAVSNGIAVFGNDEGAVATYASSSALILREFHATNILSSRPGRIRLERALSN